MKGWERRRIPSAVFPEVVTPQVGNLAGQAQAPLIPRQRKTLSLQEWMRINSGTMMSSCSNL